MKLPNIFATLRVQMIVFMTITLLVTILVVSYVNQRLERRTSSQVEEYIQAITVANDLVYQSFLRGAYLYDLVNDPQTSSLVINDQSIIRQILVVGEDGKVTDSTERSDLGRQLPASIRDVPLLHRGNINLDEGAKNGEQLRTMTTTLTTDKGRRTIVVVISMDRLQRVKDEVGRIRLAALGAMGLALIVLIAWYTRSATRPIAELVSAARRVARTDLEFEVPATGRDEIGTLSRTFNEMLADLRRKKDLEEELRRAEQSAVVGRLASGIAHEIRNPLNFINLSIDHLTEKLAPNREASHILGMIKDEIGRLNQMVSDFLSYGRPARLKLRELDARVLIEEVVALISAQAGEQGVRVEVTSESDADTTVQGDPEQLRTCFSNLMINAIQAMPSGGDLKVTLRTRDDNLIVEVEDSGVGILPEHFGQIFEPYYSTKETGIGLGLPLTRKIIEEHGGTVEVTSEPAVGTRFKVALPRKHDEGEAAAVSSGMRGVANQNEEKE